MSFIAPNTTIKFIRNCPLESSYQHTLYWDKSNAGKAQQTAYFNSIVKTPVSKYTLTNQSYQRSNKGKMRVQLKMEDLIDCNYLMFQNTSFENKWFYAFIKRVDYVSNDVCEVTFMIDVMQTWYFDFNLMQSFVEREHSETDVSGDNLQPENFNIGNYIDNGGAVQYVDGASPYSSTKRYLLVTAFDQSTRQRYTGKQYDGIFSCLDFRIYTTSELIAYLQDLNDFDATLFDEIINVVVVPNLFNFSDTNILTKTQTQTKYIAKYNEKYTGAYSSLNPKTGKKQATIDGYFPRNNKLFTYPYNFVRFTSDNDALDFAYELFPSFSDDVPYPNSFVIDLYNVLYPVPTCVCDVYTYKMKDNGYGVLLGEPSQNNRLEITDFPQCAVSADIYKIYLGQLTSSTPVKMIASASSEITNKASQIASKVSNMDTSNFGFLEKLGASIVGGLDIVGDLFQIGANKVQEKITEIVSAPSPLPERTAEVKGSQTSIADFNVGYKMFKYHYMTIKREQAERIDSYFDRYGYATNMTKIPNISARPEWNYVKTVGCLIDGAMPSDDEEAIQAIFDNGITFWKNPAHVGDYSYDNSLS